jgi:hypothetical protein
LENDGASQNAQSPFRFYSLLQKSCFLETEETPTDDDVIQEVDLKDLRSRRNALGDL